ncbi:LPS assembly lipoprotein LptE [Salinisphaera sp. Q1T1-3]|uniref:LPS-assembly lipoprotein LptE n=1 Tax=Salinisphaera sp. Q1T1-3 TaxID=2321229 RepID=UPI0011C37007|nr:LPS assembly lipoprotein LptE [Salinisphaera sp. Q1T1-3]
MHVHVIRTASKRSATGLGRLAVGSLLLLWLAGCGFHLQGANPLPKGIDRMDVTYHDDYSVGDPELVTALRQRLRRRHLLGDGGAPAELRIVSVQSNQRTVAVSPVDGDSSVYEVTVRAIFNYSVRGADQLTGETVVDSREYTSDATQQLSSDDERRHLLNQMQEDLANRVLERIARHNQRDVGATGDPASGASTD